MAKGTKKERALLLQQVASELETIIGRTGQARYLCELRPDLFDNTESARQYLKYREGASGEENRQRRGWLGIEPKISSSLEYWQTVNGYKEEKRPPYFFVKPTKALILSDIHFPVENMKSIEIALNEGLKRGATVLYINGDSLDLTLAGRFTVMDIKRPDIQAEFDMCYEFLKTVRPHFEQVFFKFGNHEERLQKAILTNAKFLATLRNLPIEQQLKLADLDITYLKHEPAVMGKLWIYHGHELPGGGTVNPARGVRMKVAHDVLYGHVHRPSHDIAYGGIDINGKRIKHQVFTSGNLSTTAPEWNPSADIYPGWRNGCVFVESFETGDYELTNYEIDDDYRLSIHHQARS